MMSRIGISVNGSVTTPEGVASTDLKSASNKNPNFSFSRFQHFRTMSTWKMFLHRKRRIQRRRNDGLRIAANDRLDFIPLEFQRRMEAHDDVVGEHPQRILHPAQHARVNTPFPTTHASPNHPDPESASSASNTITPIKSIRNCNTAPAAAA